MFFRRKRRYKEDLKSRDNGMVSIHYVPGRGGEIADLLFVLARGATLEGQVLTTDGEPVEGARVMVDRPSGITDAEGFYRVEGLPPGKQTVEVQHYELNRVVRTIELEPGENTLDLTMEAGYPVSGRVRAEDGTLVEGADVELQGGKHFRTYSAVTDEAGNALAVDYVWSFTTADMAHDWEQLGGQVSPAGAESEDPTMLVLGTTPAVGYRHESFRTHLNIWNGSDWNCLSNYDNS